MAGIFDSLSNLGGKIPQFWNKETEQEDQQNLTHLATPQILEIGNVLNAIVENIDWEGSAIDSLQKIKLETPRVVVVGTQSSGKSSVLNGILAMDMLPIGRNMVTRTPLNLQLIQTEGDMSVEFGNYEDGLWRVERKIKMTSPEPTIIEIENIREEIENQTIKRAGKGCGISTKEIILKFYSPNVPNLSLIDLPGLTMVACTDRGQPKDIKDQIRSLVSKYIQSEKSLILAVMAARPDLEADMGLDLVKEFDPRGQRTIGVLTKVDLMNNENNISDYLYNNVSVDLRTKYGYFAVRNRSSSEMMTMTHKKGLEREAEYFNGHPVYGAMDDATKKRIGIRNLGGSLSKILIEHIRKSLPNLLSNLKELQSYMEKIVKDLGTSIPDDDDAKITYLNNLINNFVKQYISSLEHRGSTINVGRRLRDYFDECRKNLDNVNPFKDSEPQYYKDVIRNCEGNHMSLFSLPIEAPEYCLRDKDRRPFHQLLIPSNGCLQDITIELRQLVDEIIDYQHLERFPKFISKLRDIINLEIIDPCESKTRDEISALIEVQEQYIWAHDDQFDSELKKTVAQHNIDNQELLRQIVEKYFSIIKNHIKDSVPKRIMFHLVNQVEKDMYASLFRQSNSLMKVLSENPEEEEKRKKYRKCLKALQMANQVFEKLS